MSTMKILMLESKTGSVDGVTNMDFIEGEVYEVPVSLGEVFVDEMGVAELAKDPIIDEDEDE